MTGNDSSFFDPPIERRASDSTKWSKFHSEDHDVIGAWVADMDLPTSDIIIDAIKARLDERVFGYNEPPDQFFDVIIERLERKYGWRTEPEWFVPQPGVVPSLFFASSCLGDPGDGVMAARPNYHYFLKTAGHTGRAFQPVDCHLDNGRWEMDFDQMKQNISPRTRSFLLCNPFNPVGRVLDEKELRTIAELCLSNGTMICSDEIHADLVLDTDKEHIPIACLDPEVEKNSITLVSASKAFNLPAIGGCSLAIIPDPDLREAFEHRSFGVATHPGALAYAATLTAFRDCDDWLAEALDYIRANRDYLEAEIAEMDGLEMAHVEATFLAWINASTSGLADPVAAFLEHGVAVSDGAPMGNAEYFRLNFACHRSTLEEIVRRIRTSLP